MSARRHSTRLAMAVSSILAAPAIATGFGLVAGLALAPEARAQETTSQLGGIVVDAEGKPVAGAQVTILHVPSGTTGTVTTNASGQFVATGLRVGGPYTVTASMSGYQSAGVENVYAELGRRASVSLTMATTAQLAEVEVTAAGIGATAIGVGTEFTAETIANAPSINRDLKGTLRIDPKAWIDPTNQDALEVAGVNNRYNSITVDGVRQSDDFGLNNNGYPTQRSPISLDAVEAVSLQTAPFDVQYSSFRGSTINVVTKSGTNDFDGSLYYYTYDDSMVGDKSADSDYDFAFEEEKWGAALRGPIIKDKLFFSLSYEKLDKKAPQDYGPTGSGAAIEVPGVTLEEYNDIVRITKDVYKYDPGSAVSSLPEEDEKMFAKIDWNISDSHRASLSYQRTEGNEVIQTNNSSSRRELSTPSDWYNRAVTMDSYSLQLFSDWSEVFSTEVKLARKEVETLQDALGGTDFANFLISTSGGTVFVGPDVFRHANYLSNDLDSVKLKGNLFLGDHTVSMGYEREMLDIFNLFVPYSLGQYQFSSIDNYENKIASRLDYRNAFSNDANDNAAAFSYNMDSIYIQDSWQVTPDFELQAGLRYDWFSSNDKPNYNENFEERYGFSNQETLDGRDLIMPRVGFNWRADEDTLVRGGVGLFGGGTPNVWVSNSYSNDGVTYVSTRGSGNELLLGANGEEPGYEIPQSVQDRLTSGDGGVNAIFPDFKIPSQWRYNLGVEHFFANDWKVTVDVIHSNVKDEVVWQDINLRQVRTAPDGRPIYESVRSGVQDIILGNTSDGKSTVFTIDLSKSWETKAGFVDLYAGYGHQDVQDVNPGTSSTASSNWDNVQVTDPNNPALATSNYEIEHRFTMALNWKKAFFKDAYTSAGLFLESRSGRPYSYTFYQNNVWGDPRQNSRSRQLFYVPAAGDENVVYKVCADGSNQNVLTCTENPVATASFAASVNALIDGTRLSNYRGQIAPRNAFNSPWVTTADLRLAQEIPLGWKDLRALVTLDIENLTNLLNSDWGRLEQVNFNYGSPVLKAAINSDGDYVYFPIETFDTRVPPDKRGRYYQLAQPASKSGSALASVWRIQLGFRIEF